jgi:rare lipoprotein A
MKEAPVKECIGPAGLLAILLATLLAPACAPKAKRDYHWPAVERPAPGTVVEGIASYYGPKYHGKQTASGERFDKNALTAAHQYWAFGTRVKVTLLSTGRSVVLRINDRFPGYKGRVIDISEGAARTIGLIGPGTGKVRLEIVR